MKRFQKQRISHPSHSATADSGAQFKRLCWYTALVLWLLWVIPQWRTLSFSFVWTSHRCFRLRLLCLRSRDTVSTPKIGAKFFLKKKCSNQIFSEIEFLDPVTRTGNVVITFSSKKKSRTFRLPAQPMDVHTPIVHPVIDVRDANFYCTSSPGNWKKKVVHTRKLSPAATAPQCSRPDENCNDQPCSKSSGPTGGTRAAWKPSPL